MSATESLVSIIIPAYNYGRYVSQAIDSALAQTWANREIIVVDDGSTDSTPEVLAPYGDRIRYHYKRNAGLSAARNTGIELARGEFLQFLDADDLLGPDSVEQRLSMLKANPDAAFAVCRSSLFIDRFGRRWSWNGWPLPRAVEMDLAFVYFNIAPPHAFLVRASAVNDLESWFDTGLRACEDYDFWFRLASVYGLPAVAGRGLVHYRKHPVSMSQNRAAQYAYDAAVSKKIAKYLYDCAFASRHPIHYLIVLLASSLVTLRRLVHTAGSADADSYLKQHVLPLVMRIERCDAERCDARALLRYWAVIRSITYDLAKRDEFIDDETVSRMRGAVARRIPVVPFHYSSVLQDMQYFRRVLQFCAVQSLKRLSGNRIAGSAED